MRMHRQQGGVGVDEVSVTRRRRRGDTGNEEATKGCAKK